MPPKTKQPANGKFEAKPKLTAAPAAPAASSSAAELPKSTVAKPDATAYHAEQDALKKEIDELQAKLVCISFVSSGSLPELNPFRTRSRKRLLSPREPVETNAGMLFVPNWMPFVVNRAVTRPLVQSFWSRSRQCKPGFKTRYVTLHTQYCLCLRHDRSRPFKQPEEKCPTRVSRR